MADNQEDLSNLTFDEGLQVDKEKSSVVTVKCHKLQMTDNLVAYLKRQEMSRDVQPFENSSLTDKVVSNYIIVKQIISNLSWQDKLLCKLVCSTWHSAVLALEKEQLSPEDFVIDRQSCTKNADAVYKKSGNYYTEPVAILIFSNVSAFSSRRKCNNIIPNPCTPPCGKNHCMLDMVQKLASSPKDCMFIVKACHLSYMPLQHSPTYKHKIGRDLFRSSPFIGGFYIPAIQNVKFHVINVKSYGDLKKEFFEVVDKIAVTQIIKGVLVYATDKYLLIPVEDIDFLNYFKEVQPNVPYALGGCIVEDAIFGQSEVHNIIDGINADREYISENMISIGIFTILKNAGDANNGDKSNFDMYSLIIESSDWSKAKIQQAINEFSKKVPHFEHSVVIKLSCVGRDERHLVEQDYFRAAFPNTRLIGCYGNGELGINHPPRNSPESHRTPKKPRKDSTPHQDIMYSYSTVFVYIGWGRITQSPQITQ